MMKLLLAVSLYVAVGSAQPTITWTHKSSAGPTYPGATGQTLIFYVPLLGGTYLRAVVPGSGSIYTTDDYVYYAGSNTFAHMGGTGTTSVGTCPANDTLTQPANRHTDSQLAFDPLRNWVWMRGGLNQNCGIQTLGNCSYPGGEIPACSFYANHLNATPTNDWNFVDPTTSISLAVTTATLFFDSDDNVLFAWGGNYPWPILMFCPTDINPTPGTLTAAQTTAGCTTADIWTQLYPNQGSVNVANNGDGTSTVTYVSGDNFPTEMTYITIGGTSTTNGTLYVVASVTDSTHVVITGSLTASAQKWFTSPPGVLSSTALYDPVTHAAYFFGGQSTNLTTNWKQAWKYVPASKKFVQVALGQTGPDVTAGAGNLNKWSVAYSSSRVMFYVHQGTGTGSPADWQYDPVNDLWTQLTSVGTGPTNNSLMSYDETAGLAVTADNLSGPGTPYDFWTARISGAAAAATKFLISQ